MYKNKSLKSLTLIWGSLVLFSSCGPVGRPAPKTAVQHESSHRNDEAYSWGHLSGLNTRSLVYALPGEVVGVCGPFADELAEGIRKWSAAAFREKGLRVLSDCTGNTDRTIRIYGAASAVAQKRCAPFPQAAALTYLFEGIVVVCGDISRAKAVMLHEAGHLWGMCDVYPEEVAGAGDCDPHYFTRRGRGTVMGASYANDLSSDDKVGIQRLIERREIGANLKWFDAKIN